LETLSLRIWKGELTVQDALELRELLGDEVIQLRQSGHELDGALLRVQEALASGGRGWLPEFERAYDELEEARVEPGWPYAEPSGLQEILATLGSDDDAALRRPSGEVLRDRVHAAWLGRCVGCNLGKPVEGLGWNREKLRRYLEQAGSYPITDYLPVIDPMPAGMVLDESWRVTTRGRVNGMARDDDTDYTILGLHILEEHGFGFTTAQVGAEWLLHLPFGQTYTAERVAYRNLVRGLAPPHTARYRNPYREWIGALIRADAFGYACPGRPRRAALLAYRDAALSHTANGIYGEMWAAALTAASFAVPTAREALDIAMAAVPPASRLAEALRAVRVAFDSGLSWDKAMDQVERDLGGYHWIHTVNNAAVVAAALLWGEGDFTKSIGLAVAAGLDTDSDGATVGSVFGALHGTAALPAHWVDPLRDTIHSAIADFDSYSISGLAERTVALARTGAGDIAGGDAGD
jgi:ADP-ribosylglycohydrolase